jgi:PAS domain S-box-containing protein
MTPLQLFLYGLAIAVGGLGLSVLAANARSAAHRCFALTALIIAGWTLGVGGRLGGAGIESWLRLSFACASLIPPAVLAFASVYPLDGRRPARLVLRLSILLGCLFAILSLTTRLIFFDPVLTPTGLSRRAGPLYPFFAAYFLLTWAHFLGVLLGNTVKARGRARARLQYVSAAAIITSAGGISTNLLLPLLTGRSSYTWLGPCFGVVFLLLIGHAIVRHRLLDVKFVVHRGLPLVLAAAASLLPLALPLVWFWPQLSSSLPSTEWPLLVVALLGGGLLVPLTRRGALKLLDRYLYRAKPDYEPTVQEISKALTQVLDRGPLLDVLVTRLTKIVQPEGLAIYLVEDAVGTLATRHAAAGETFPVPDLMPRSVLQALETNRDVIEAGERHRLLGELGWALVLPLIADGVVIGAIVVGPKLSGDLYYPQDLALLRTLANQAAVAVKNAQLYAEVVLANEAIENIVATMNSGVIAISADGRITLFNRAAELLTGLRADRVRLHSVNVLPACLAEPLIRAVADGRGITCPEITLTDGVAVRSIISTVSPLRDKTGAVLGGVSVFSDLTPLQELEHERRRAEKLNYFESLASGLAHEIKNPLVAIKTFVQLIPLRLNDIRWLGDFSRLVEREIDRIERLLNRLATLGRAGTRPHRRLDLRVPIRDALELVQPALATKRLTVTVRLGEREEPVLGDQDELTQLVHNLLINALEHTPIGGTVAVELGASDHLVNLTVADSGPGIRSEHLERVFDPFFTTRRDGTGLGLAICMGIAAAHRARIRVANHPEHGAIFTVEFPVTVVEPAAEVSA